MRVFYGVFPSKDTRDELVRRRDEWLRAMRLRGINGRTPRLTSELNLHVTLAFIGSVDEQQLIACRQALQEVRAPFVNALRAQTMFDVTDAFTQARVAVLRSTSPPAAWLELVEALREMIGAKRLALDERPWLPHVTLARHAVCDVTKLTEPVLWTSQAGGLIESVSGPRGVEYRLIDRVF